MQKRNFRTLEACSVIHGGSSVKPELIIEGMHDTLTSKFKTKQILSSIFSGKQALVNTIKKNVSKKWTKKFYISQENNALFVKHLLLS